MLTGWATHYWQNYLKYVSLYIEETCTGQIDCQMIIEFNTDFSKMNGLLMNKAKCTSKPKKTKILDYFKQNTVFYFG